MSEPTLQDFSLVRTFVKKIRNDLNLSDAVSAFYYFVLDSILKLQENEIDDSITDSNYLSLSGKPAGHDIGIDALYIDSTTSPTTVHIFNCKYTEQFEKLDNNYSASEIDKLLPFFRSLMQNDTNLIADVNAVLYTKVEEVWDLFRNEVPRFEVHLCSNQCKEMEPQEHARLKRELAKYFSVSVSYHLMADYVSLLTRRNKIEVNARVRGHDKLLFEKSDGDIRALITSMDARDLLRIVSADEDFRKQTDVEDFGLLKQKGILQDAFEDNVRIYLKQRSKINRNIKETAVSDLRMRFFYYNNGITMTCKRFGYSKTKYPIIEIEGLQVVNGGQTIHALFDAYCENSTDFEQIEVLCRIYETNDAELSTAIAEYTNSQNPVKSRDIRSNDYIQKKLETELQAKGYFYERKKNQQADKPKAKRIDMEKAGQALMAFYNEMPAEAKDNKPLIFGDKYEDVFNDDVTADRVIAVSSLLDEIENKKKQARKAILDDPDEYEKDTFVPHATFYFLYTIMRLATLEGAKPENAEYKAMIKYYTRAKREIAKAVQQERKSLRGHEEIYNHRVFFKGDRPKQHIDAALRQKTAR